MTELSSESCHNKNTKSLLSGELAEKITQGDETASNEFVQINYRWLLFIIRKKFVRSNNHEDIVQDSFMIVINKLQQGKIRETKAILGFLRTTAINIGFEYLRKDKKFTSAIDQDLLDVIEDGKDDILSTIIWNDKVKYVKQVMSELKIQRDKDILIKFYFHDLDKPAICEELNLSSEHFDRVLYRAKQRLKQLITQKGDNNPNSTIRALNKDNLKSKSSLTLKITHMLSGLGLQFGNMFGFVTITVMISKILTKCNERAGSGLQSRFSIDLSTTKVADSVVEPQGAQA